MSGSGRSVDVVINDRGPYIGGRIIDLSKAAAGVIGMTAQGIARVTVQILGLSILPTAETSIRGRMRKRPPLLL